MYQETGAAAAMSCPDRNGTMPSCAPLAVGYVPFQQSDPKRYGERDALSNGTLYPSLNLPFHLMVGGSKLPQGLLADLQALSFVLLELGTYLDTHPGDEEAFALFKRFAAMEKTARDAYEKQRGPLTRKASAQSDRYDWLQDPWPWNYEGNEVK